MASEVPDSYPVHQITYRWHPQRDMYPAASSMSPESTRVWGQRIVPWVRHPTVDVPTDSVRYEIFPNGKAALAWRGREQQSAEVPDGRVPVSRVLCGPAAVLAPEVAAAVCHVGVAKIIGPLPGTTHGDSLLPVIDAATLTRLPLEMAETLDEAAAREFGLVHVVAAALDDRDTPLAMELPEQLIARSPWGGSQALLLWGLWRIIWPLIGRDGRRNWSFSTFELPLGATDPSTLPAIVFRPAQISEAPASTRREIRVRPYSTTSKAAEALHEDLAKILVAVYRDQGGDALRRRIVACADDNPSAHDRIQAVAGMLTASQPVQAVIKDESPPAPVEKPARTAVDDVAESNITVPSASIVSDAAGRDSVAAPADTPTVIELAVSLGGTPGTLNVEVVFSPAGEASAVATLDVDGLLAQREQLQWAVLASGAASRRVLPETERPVREIGKILFDALLGAGEVYGQYRAAAALAAARERRLRVVLRINAPALAALPWEAMYDEDAAAYVCRKDELVRHVGVASAPLPLQVRPPLRILGIVSSPRGLPMLDVQQERDHLARALARPISQGLIEIHWTLQATWANLHDILLEGPWHVIHYIGHGDWDPVQDGGVLSLVADDGRVHNVAAHHLIDLLRQASPMPRLVILNSCAGAQGSVTDLFSATATALVQGGISAVTAMQYAISDNSAAAFARGFYTAVAHGRGVDDAVTSGRVAILGTNDYTLEWLTPVLYLRGRDAQLFRYS